MRHHPKPPIRQQVRSLGPAREPGCPIQALFWLEWASKRRTRSFFWAPRKSLQGDHLCERSTASSFTRERNSFNTDEGFALRYPTDKSIFGPSPCRGRVVTVSGRKVFAYNGRRATPPVEAMRDMTLPRLSTSWLGLILTPLSWRNRSIARRKRRLFSRNAEGRPGDADKYFPGELLKTDCPVSGERMMSKAERRGTTLRPGS